MLRLKSINFDFKILDLKFRIPSCLEFGIFRILFYRVFLAFYFTWEPFAAPDRAACDVKAIVPKLLPIRADKMTYIVNVKAIVPKLLRQNSIYFIKSS